MEAWRLRVESREVNDRFPLFRLIELKDGRLAWRGEITTRFGNFYEVAIVYSWDYPSSAPKVYPFSRIYTDKHRFKDGSLCTHLPHEWSPNFTAATVIGWVAAWLHAYDVYKRTGNWPGREAY